MQSNMSMACEIIRRLRRLASSRAAVEDKWLRSAATMPRVFQPRLDCGGDRAATRVILREGLVSTMIDRRKFLAAASGTLALAGLKARALDHAPLKTALQNHLASDPLRPQYHFLPAANWMNDPNGPIFWNGNYHMFCQYNPNGANWGVMHWAHATSSDMVHWKHLPVALAPTPGGPDSGGCFTGTALVHEGRVHMLYTGVRPAPEDEATIKNGVQSLLETQCMAVAQDVELKSWTKLAKPVIAAPPSGMEVNGFRDPSPWEQGQWWYTVLGTGIAGRGGAVLLYRSRDLHSWEFMHILAQRDQHAPGIFDPVDPWEVWECPDFFPLGDRHVLIYSTLGKSYWQCGKLDSHSMMFHADQSGILDFGAFYAPKSQLDQSGNRILWGWIQETRPLEDYVKAGWAGMMSLPRVLTLTADGHLRFKVAREVEQLRKAPRTLSLDGGEQAIQSGIAAMVLKDCCGEIVLSARRTADPFELTLTGSEKSAPPWLRIKYDPAHRDQAFIDGRSISLSLSDAENLECRMYVDGSVIELLVNGQRAWTKRFYYTGDAQILRMQWHGSTAAIARLAMWQYNPISSNRLTT